MKYIEFFLPIYQRCLPQIKNTIVLKNLKLKYCSILENFPDYEKIKQNQKDFFFKHLIIKAEIFQEINFYTCLINNKLCYLQKYKDQILIFNRKLTFYTKFSLIDLCKIREKGQKSICLIFRNYMIKIKFFIKWTKHHFMNELLLESEYKIAEHNIRSQSFIKSLFISMISKNQMVLFDIIQLTERVMRKSNVFYKPDVNDLIKSSHFYPLFNLNTIILNKKLNNELFDINYTLFSEFQFFINQKTVLEKMFRTIFYSYHSLLYVPSLEEIRVLYYLLSQTLKNQG